MEIPCQSFKMKTSLHAQKALPPNKTKQNPNFFIAESAESTESTEHNWIIVWLPNIIEYKKFGKFWLLGIQTQSNNN